MVVLDTDIVIALLKGDKKAINTIQKCEEPIAITMVSVFELLKGSYRSANPEKKRDEVMSVVESFRVLEFSYESANIAAMLEAKLLKKGTPIGTLDVFIAGMCLATKNSIITRNTKHFEKVSELTVKTC